MWLRLVAVLCAVSLGGCKRRVNASDPKVLNGRAAKEYDDNIRRALTSVILLVNAKGNICTATAISKKYLITAAHCVEKADKSLGTVKALTPEGAEIPSLAVFRHPFYEDPGRKADRNSAKYDIAIVKLWSDTGEALGVERYPSLAKRDLGPGDKVIVAGYGRTSFSGVSGELYLGTNRVDSADTEIIQVSGTQKSGMEGYDAVSHKGDSGGPLFDWEWNLAGVTSQGDREDDTKHEMYVNARGEIARWLYENVIRCEDDDVCPKGFLEP